VKVCLIGKNAYPVSTQAIDSTISEHSIQVHVLILRCIILGSCGRVRVLSSLIVMVDEKRFDLRVDRDAEIRQRKLVTRTVLVGPGTVYRASLLSLIVRAGTYCTCVDSCF
jgi:hypothetical protein